jgi:serine/threonine protein kinase
VKKLRENSQVPPEKQFSNEVVNLMAIQHENIVKLVGFCHESHKKVVEHNKKYIIVDVAETFLCYEYLPRGSLDKYIFGTYCNINLLWHPYN